MNGNIRAFFALSLVGLLATSGCATTRKVEMGSTPILQAQRELPPEMLLDVGIQAFDPGIPEDADEMIFPEVRRAESRYVPFHLKRTLQQSGNWGAIWIVPLESHNTDLLLQGTIRGSDGESLELEIRLVDATGRVWLEQRYRGEADLTSYINDEAGVEHDPFQDLYNQIANDMLGARDLHSAGELIEIRQLTQLRFASDLAPDAFAHHLGTDEDGIVTITRLPSQDDPMMARVEMLRERDYMLMDTLNEHYGEFYTSMSDAYRQFREFNYEEVKALRELRRDAHLRLAIGTLAMVGALALAVVDGGITSALLAGPLLAGGLMGVQSGMQLRSESTLHAIAVQELGRSFESDVEPRVLEIEGRTLKLTGSAETQYRTWRRLLREIYRSETGFVGAADVFETPDVSSGPKAGAHTPESLSP